MNNWIMERLRCPFCGAGFGWFQGPTAASGQYAILTWDCGRYPVVDDICVLKKGTTIDEATKRIERGRTKDALLSLLPFPSSPAEPNVGHWHYLLSAMHQLEKIANLKRSAAPGSSPDVWAEYLSHPDQITVQDLLTSYFHDKKNNFDYFFHRFSQPRYLVGISFASIISSPRGPLLDLACGCGHITRNLVYRAEGHPVVGIDRFFLGLYVAKHMVAPEATYVCCDVDALLPFSDKTFEAAICSDAFHYFLNKKACIRELERVCRDDGYFMLVWNHNAAVRMANDGLSLLPQAYEHLVSDIPHCW